MGGMDDEGKIKVDEKNKVVDNRLKQANINPEKVFSINRQLNDEQITLEWDEIFIDLLHEGSKNKIKEIFKTMCCRKHDEKSTFRKFFRLICCFSWAGKMCKRGVYTKKSDKSITLSNFRLAVSRQEELDKIAHYFKRREQEILRRRSYLGPFYGSLTREVLQD